MSGLTDEGVAKAARMNRERRQAARALPDDVSVAELDGLVTVVDHVLGDAPETPSGRTGPTR